MMKKIKFFPIIAIVLMLLGLNACDKSENNNAGDGFISSYTNTTISGIVFDENHAPVQGAKVEAHGYTKYTDVNGTFVFAKISVPKNRCFVSVSYNNYFSIMRSSTPIIGGVTRIDAHLLAKADGQEDQFQAGSAYTAFVSNGSLNTSLSFASSTEFVDHLGNPYTGTVILNTYILDASSDAYSRHAPGGDQIGFDDYQEQLLDAYTGTMIEISDNNGMPLQLAANTTPVDLSQTIPAAFTGTAPGTIPVYYASASAGYNSREGSATENGGEYETAVGHFSYWSTQVASPEYGELRCRVIDASGNRLSGVRVQVGKAYGITDENGMFERKVPTGVAMDVAILPLDFYGFSVVSPQTAWANGEERLVELQLPNDVDFVQGRIVDCYGQPVEGMVTLTWNSNISSGYASGGNFNLPTLAGAASYDLNIQTAEKDTVITISVQSGVNDFGDVSICDVEPLHNLIRVIGQSGTVIGEYTSFDFTDGHNYVEAQTSEYLSTYIMASGTDVSFSISSEHIGSEGSYDIQDNSIFIDFSTPDLPSTNMIESGTLEITEFGEVGGRIKGTVVGHTSNMEDVVIEFEVVRKEDVPLS